MSKTLKKYDVCVIGAGIGGLSVAAACSMLGLKTALVEKNEMGGDCLNHGTVPTKALITAARKVFEAKKASSFGVEVSDINVNFKVAQDHISESIKPMGWTHSRHRYEALGADIFHGNASFESDRQIAIEGQGFSIMAKNFVIATGSRPDVADLEGLKEGEYYTSETIFNLEEQPEHLVIIGGGPIGIEMAQAHHRLGSKVTLLSRGPILSKEDPELVEVIRKQLILEGINLHEDAHVKGVSKKKVIALIGMDKSEKKISFSHLLIATGAKPNVANLGLVKAGVSYTPSGVNTDKRLRTNAKHIYAMGGCSNAPQFSYVASYHAGVVIKNMLFKLPTKVDYTSLPRVVYTDPVFAQVGVTEKQARELYDERHLSFLRSSFFENDRARIEKRDEGMTKIIAYKKRIIGGAIVGPHAEENIQFLTLAIAKKMTISDLASYICPASTYGECIKQAAGDYLKPKIFTPFMQKLVQFLHKIG